MSCNLVPAGAARLLLCRFHSTPSPGGIFTSVCHAAGFVEYSSFSEATDSGMTCAWNPSGTLLAAGFQDGSVIIWDPRAHRVQYLHALKQQDTVLLSVP